MRDVWKRAQGWSVEAWPCLPLLAVGLIGTGPAATFQPEAARPLDPLAYALVVAAALALAVRRRPGTALTVNGAAAAAYLAAGYPFGPILLTLPVAVFGVAAAWPIGRATTVVAADFGVQVVALFAKTAPAAGESSSMAADVSIWAAVALVTLAVGISVRVRREAADGLRSEHARRVASEERLRMAQDLHDTIGHGLAAIAMQAGVALHVFDRDPAEARHAMEAVRTTSREALDNLREELERLRGDGSAPHAPAPGLDDLDALADRVRAAGIEVTVEVQPNLGLARPVDAAAFRIVREALTNVLRHAGAATTRVLVCRDGSELLVEVTDTGTGTLSVPEEGLGIRGMRAQVETLGGKLEAGPRSGGGFAVRAQMPVEATT
ncbi:sensor histidine kinase [Nonomuraea diastatica]|uniref:histidine kinase n=1 Tax=Nonomuraea diastatica TaxID=1848329 RepID=A0A4R4VBS8_9ACTN|nr:sensor histidine kinase [Nonomuraea diastatica]TDD02879.1 sensor histidine kinase [Nonomuraea diastatica]